MAVLVPVVTPPNSQTGVEIGVSPTAIFAEAIDVGSILPTSCFLVSTNHEDSFLDSIQTLPSSIQTIITATVTAERLDLVTDDVVTTKDYGDPLDTETGVKYRTKITIDPDQPLDKNVNYVVILSKDLTKLTVFDPELTSGAGTGEILSKGVYTGLASETYNIVITNSGVNNTAKYTWTRSSDSFTSSIQDAKERFIEIDQGVKIKFGTGSFVAGNTYRIRVVPADYLNDFYSWSFSTGSTDFEVPEDENSNELVNVPATGTAVVSPSSEVDFYVVSIKPELAKSLIPLPQYARTTIQDIIFVANEYGLEFNNYNIELTDGATAGSEIVSISGKDITIQIEDNVSTEQQVVDAFNASALVSTDFTASTDQGTITVEITDTPAYFNGGKNSIIIEVEFNKNIDPASIEPDSIKLIAESLVPGTASEELNFEYEVLDNVLVITPI